MSEGAGAPAVEVSQELARRLHEVGRAVSPSEIGEVWIFPPLADVEESAEFLLFTRVLEEDRRRLYSARLRRLAGEQDATRTVDGDGRGHGNGNGATPAADGDGGTGRRHEITEHGSVPADRVSRLVERFRRRLGEGGEPRHLVIGGSLERWTSLLPASFDGNGNGSEAPPELESREMQG